ncbi:MAG: hypothetical protein HYV63_30875 [Candidatus Schekmanbacteria bacterium]|nr:hypothetical protein [Candidatus Schekmanbacteria bacterium]
MTLTGATDKKWEKRPARDSVTSLDAPARRWIRLVAAGVLATAAIVMAVLVAVAVAGREEVERSILEYGLAAAVDGATLPLHGAFSPERLRHTASQFVEAYIHGGSVTTEELHAVYSVVAAACADRSVTAAEALSMQRQIDEALLPAATDSASPAE